MIWLIPIFCFETIASIFYVTATFWIFLWKIKFQVIEEISNSHFLEFILAYTIVLFPSNGWSGSGIWCPGCPGPVTSHVGILCALFRYVYLKRNSQLQRAEQSTDKRARTINNLNWKNITHASVFWKIFFLLTRRSENVPKTLWTPRSSHHL